MSLDERGQCGFGGFMVPRGIGRLKSFQELEVRQADQRTDTV
jgi:hypothetical protein